ncbi:MAG: hypothetical protein GPOALKHO_001295 [Sodalis sp.]|uniref:hypothetical protein n=1 Tax=Sodalis sp. (in: enterobacteria) TaxID=1898979 RepID=UPI0038734EF6|nr:MAG: hypothetical protein GPOALKHO_001295 [Sodalis sp.]
MNARLFWRLFTTWLMFTLTLELLSFVGCLVVGFLVSLIRLYGPKGIADLCLDYMGKTTAGAAVLDFI